MWGVMEPSRGSGSGVCLWLDRLLARTPEVYSQQRALRRTRHTLHAIHHEVSFAGMLEGSVVRLYG